MENLSDFLIFFDQFGGVLTAIAIVGVALLGFLKYCNVFKNIAENKRHYLYLAISIGFSIVASAIYLACIGAFNLDYLLAVSAAIYALNQTFYGIFKVTPINRLFVSILDFIKGLFTKKEES